MTRPDDATIRLRAQIELNARARERDPLPDAQRTRKPGAVEGNHITEADLLMGYRGLRDREEAER